MEQARIIDNSIDFPDPEAARRLSSLVGIDEQRARLEKGLRLVLNPNALDKWSESHHKKRLPIVDEFKRRPPLFILAGDVGVGKTALAESVGDAVARAEKIGVTLYRMSLSSRGSGLVGEMTRLITTAFSEVADAAKKSKSSTGQARGGHILLIDEADALAQSRETTQMHHEDRAGVNALIRGIDELAIQALPAAVIMCTNRLSALDPAIQRRAAEVLRFSRPNDEQRKQILSRGLSDAGFTATQLEQLVGLTGPQGSKTGFTFSDLTQRFLPSIVLDAFPDRPLSIARALEIARTFNATPVFRDEVLNE